MRNIIIILFIALLPGCQLLAPKITKAADSVASGIESYCAEVDQAARAAFRAEVNQKLKKGQSITVTCE